MPRTASLIRRWSPTSDWTATQRRRNFNMYYLFHHVLYLFSSGHKIFSCLSNPSIYFSILIPSTAYHFLDFSCTCINTSITIFIAAKKCGINKVFLECGPACQKTCENKTPKCHRECVRGCFCARGYFRDKDLNCIKEDECPLSEFF